MSATDVSFAGWRSRLVELADGVRHATRRELENSTWRELARVAGRGVGDVTFALDLAAEGFLDRWLDGAARRDSLSLLTEDAGWRHRGPDGRGGVTPLPDFDHGGPRIAVDPIDGTRNLLADLRSAWTVVSFAASGEHEPRYGELRGGIVSEIPPRRVWAYRRLSAALDGGCEYEERELGSDERLAHRDLSADADDRVDHGYFPVFRYRPEERPASAALEAEFFLRLERHERADLSAIWDDQYISNAGQLVLLALGIYRMIIDPRALLARRRGAPSVTSKPYDVAGALLVAAEAGAVVTHADGSPLDFPIDATTPVDFAGWANAQTRARLEPHWLAALRARP
jgi:fructose-1,6-bisphosphatase/inositol monophosphatase family enzyme